MNANSEEDGDREFSFEQAKRML